MLHVLDWKLDVKTPYHYVHELVDFCGLTLEGAFENIVNRYINASPYFHELLKFHPAVVASASIINALQDAPFDHYLLGKYLRILSRACSVQFYLLHHACEIMANFKRDD